MKEIDKGLSTPHNCTRTGKTGKDDELCSAEREWGATLQLWPSGSVARVKLDTTYRKSGSSFSPYEDKKQITVPSGGGVRGTVDPGFSADSRRRLLRECGKMDRGYLPVLFTLTFADDEWEEDPQQWKVLTRRFYMKLRRKYSDLSALWRLEIKTRKSGDRVGAAAPHFHLIAWFNNDRKEAVTRGELDELRAWTDQAWEYGINRVERIRSARGTSAYIAKYICKVDSEETVAAYPDGVGRLWGKWNADNLPISDLVTVQLTYWEGLALMHHFKRLVWNEVKDIGLPSLYCFMDNPLALLDDLESIIDAELTEIAAALVPI